MTVKKGFVIMTVAGEFVNCYNVSKHIGYEKRYGTCELNQASVFDMRELNAAVTTEGKLSTLLVDGVVQSVVMVEAYTTRKVALGLPPLEEE